MADPIDPQPPVEPVVETPAPETLPADTTDRTKEQFDKLKQSNQELKEKADAEAAEKEKYKNLFEGLKPADITPENKQIIENKKLPKFFIGWKT